jgi:zinc protease
MKALLYSLFCLATFTAVAQQQAPYELNINGVKVIVKPSGNDIVVVQTAIKGGVQNYPANKAGIESLAITALTECGTLKDDKNSFKNKLDKVSAQIYGNSGMDYASFTMNCIRSDFDQVWPLYTDALLTPRFDAKEFSRIKQDAINSVRASESNPDNAIDKMARHTAFAGKNYAKDPEGTVATLGLLTVADVKKHWQSIFNRNRLVIVIVGDLDKATVERNVRAMLAKVPVGAPFVQKKESYTPPANTFKPQQRENATNYIQGIAAGPQPGTPDFNAFVLAMQIFSSRHFVEVRSKNGLSYAPGAWFSPGNSSYANFFVTTTEPDKYVAVARQLIDKVKKEGFTPEELKNEKTSYVTSFYYRQETNAAQAGSYIANEVVHGNWKRALTIKDDMNKVTLEDLNRVFRTYINNITWSYQGDPKKVNQALFIQKETPQIPVEKKAF